MNSSKVFKRTSSFIPEKIFSRKGEMGSGWKSVAIPIGQGEDATVSGSESDHLHRHHSLGEHNLSGTDGSEDLGSANKNDFSAPDASLIAQGDAESSTLGDNSATLFDEEQRNLERTLEKAYDKGLRDGFKRAEEDFGSSTKALILACEQINTLRETIINNSMAEMQDLVLIIAEKIIRHSVTEQDSTIVDTVAEAIRQAVKSDEFLIQVNPADLAVIKAKSKEFIDSLSGCENIVVQANPTIERGGCRIDSSTSTVDATLAGQLQIIADKLKGKI
jgi:flagellar assembly protein FliH